MLVRYGFLSSYGVVRSGYAQKSVAVLLCKCFVTCVPERFFGDFVARAKASYQRTVSSISQQRRVASQTKTSEHLQ